MSYVNIINASDTESSSEDEQPTTEIQPSTSRAPCIPSFNNTERTLARVKSVRIDHSHDVNVGDTFIQQVISNGDVVQARFLCLKFESTLSMKRFRCSLAVFLCWTVILASTVAAVLIIFVIPQHQPRMDIDLSVPWYLRREDWQSMAEYSRKFLHLPVQYVLIGHAGTKYCNSKYTCTIKVGGLQQDQLRRGFVDIGANFLVGGNGWIFEGTGANIQSSMVLGWESTSINIMFIGNYVRDTPDQEQIDHVNVLLDVLLQKGVLSSDYMLYGSCQVATHIVSPGPKLTKRLRLFKHWNPANASTCLPGVVY